MYCIAPRVTNSWSTNDELNNLLDSIDERIGSLALCVYKNFTFGSSTPVDLDLYDDLCTYKEILMDKLLGCDCLDDTRLVMLNQRIRKLIR